MEGEVCAGGSRGPRNNWPPEVISGRLGPVLAERNGKNCNVSTEGSGLCVSRPADKAPAALTPGCLPIPAWEQLTVISIAHLFVFSHHYHSTILFTTGTLKYIVECKLYQALSACAPAYTSNRPVSTLKVDAKTVGRAADRSTSLKIVRGGHCLTSQ